MKAFVTGGTGLVGSHSIERLVSQGHEVVAMARSDAGMQIVRDLGANPVRGIVEDLESWRSARGAEVIIHAAALITTSTTWEAFERVNVHGTRLAVHAAAKTGARLVHLSSVAVYGRQPTAGNSGSVDESAPFGHIAAADSYARSKRLAEEVLWAEAERLGVSAVALRPCVIYGERERLFMSRLLSLLRFGVAPIVGSGTNTLAMVYVGNVIDAVVAALARPDVTGPFNVANDGGLTQREVYQIVAEVTGRPIRMVRFPVAAVVAFGTAWHLGHRILRPRRYSGFGSSSGHFIARNNPYSSARAERELKWQPTTPSREAWRRAVHWFVEHGDWSAR